MTANARTTVAVLADTHGFLDPRIAEHVAECDYAVHAGDVGGADVLCALRPRESIVAIRGNNDTAARWAESEAHFLENLPTQARVPLPGGDLVVVHGDDGRGLKQRHRHLRGSYPEAAAVVYGHSHRLTVDQEAVPWILNPGAAGRTRVYDGPSCLLMNCSEGEWRVESVQLPQRRQPKGESRRRRA